MEKVKSIYGEIWIQVLVIFLQLYQRHFYWKFFSVMLVFVF